MLPLGPTIQQQLLLNPPRNLADLIQRLITSYGAADIGVINGIETDMQVPLNLTGVIEDDLANMISCPSAIALPGRLSPNHGIPQATTPLRTCTS